VADYREIGAETERMVARWLRGEGWAGAERRIRTGYRTAERTVADQGDLTGLPGLCVQVKSLRPATRMELAVPGWLAETEAQREASSATLGLLVVRRWGTVDVGRWWAFLELADLRGLLDGTLGALGVPGTRLHDVAPVRLELRHVVHLLREQGWGGTEAAA